MSWHRIFVVLPLGFASLVPGCSGRKWKTEAQLSVIEQKQVQRARDATTTMFKSLLGELTSALEAGGPAAAIPVCKERAPQIARDVSRKTGVEIGRTSHRLRNPQNLPPAWAADHVSRAVPSPAYAALSGGTLGVLLPITAMEPCLPCHGEKADIDVEIQQAIASNYPSDQATGFRAGDLRGWFWVEVPAPTN